MLMAVCYCISIDWGCVNKISVKDIIIESLLLPQFFNTIQNNLDDRLNTKINFYKKIVHENTLAQ